MKKIAVLLIAMLLLTACGKKEEPVTATATIGPIAQQIQPPETPKTPAELNLADGSYTVEVTLEGGSGRATVLSPAQLDVEDGIAYVTLIWSSSNYDYMIVDGVKYDFITVEGGSTFRFPVAGFDAPLPITGDTVAMSTPHEVDYILTLSGNSIQAG